MRAPEPPSIAIAPSGVYCVRWRDTELRRTRRLSLETRDHLEAQRRFAAWLYLTDSGRALAGRAGFVTWRDIDLRRLAELERRGASARVASVSAVLGQYLADRGPRLAGLATAEQAARHLIAHMGDVPVCDVSVGHCDGYARERAAGRIGKGAGDATVRRELGVLVAAVNHCLRRGIIGRDHVPMIELPPAGMPRERWLSAEEWRRLLRHAAQVYDARLGAWRNMRRGDRLPRVYRFIMLAYHTAGRLDAVTTLRWSSQIDMERRRIDLNPPGRRQTKKRRALVPMSRPLAAMLRRAQAERTSDHVLDHPGAIRAAMECLAARAGLPDVTAHVLRHTRAMHLTLRGVPLKAVADLLGDTLATVSRHYQHHAPDYLAEVL